jgi:hypothetical protein
MAHSDHLPFFPNARKTRPAKKGQTSHVPIRSMQIN